MNPGLGATISNLSERHVHAAAAWLALLGDEGGGVVDLDRFVDDGASQPFFVRSGLVKR